MPPTIILIPKIMGRARVAPQRFANKKIAMMMLNAPRMPVPQPAPMKARISPKMPMINAYTATKMITKVPIRIVAYKELRSTTIPTRIPRMPVNKSQPQWMPVLGMKISMIEKMPRLRK
jgi:hypothetical protein